LVILPKELKKGIGKGKEPKKATNGMPKEP